MKNTAILHNPDQVAGGKANIDYKTGSINNRTDIQNSEIIGVTQANWYIGTQQWPRKENLENIQKEEEKSQKEHEQILEQEHKKRATELKEHAQFNYDKTPESVKNKLMMSVTINVE